MRSLVHLIPALALCCALPAHAAREFTPQAGLWMIPSENNGQPGRGFSLDVQGNTAFLQVFNYEKSGAATFHTAVGQLNTAASMTVPLQRFKGGRYLGGPARDAVEDGAAGNVTVTFTDGLNGTVQFPGEAVQPISRLWVPEKLPYWWSALSTSPPAGKEGFRAMQWVATTKNGIRYQWNATLGAPTDGVYPLRLGSRFEWGDALRTFDCQLLADVQVFDCLPTSNSVNAEMPNVPLEIQRLRFKVVGRDVVGQIQPAWDLAQRMTLNGWHDGSFSCNAGWCNTLEARSARTYTSSNLNESTCITGYCSGYNHVLLLPSSGAWIIADEKTGLPGRGVFLDVQDHTVILQTSDYLANGEPTFHLGASELRGVGTPTADTIAGVPLLRHAGGRHFGGPAQSGVETANAGTAQLGFSQSGQTSVTGFATGTVALPGEAPQPMHRLQLETAAPTGITHMLGEYLIEFPSIGRAPRWVRLDRIENDIARNADGSVLCQQRSVSNRYRMFCVLFPTASITPGTINGQHYTDVEVNAFNQSMANEFNARTRDRHGNWLGLGAVNLPGLALPAP